MKFNDWLLRNYEDLDNLYNNTINYIENNINSNKFLDLMSKEEFFLFIYENTEK